MSQPWCALTPRPRYLTSCLFTRPSPPAAAAGSRPPSPSPPRLFSFAAPNRCAITYSWPATQLDSLTRLLAMALPWPCAPAPLPPNLCSLFCEVKLPCPQPVLPTSASTSRTFCPYSAMLPATVACSACREQCAPLLCAFWLAPACQPL